MIDDPIRYSVDGVPQPSNAHEGYNEHQRIRFPFRCPPKPSLSGGLLAAITIPQLMNGIKRLQFQRAYARAILTVKQTMIIMAEDD